MNTVPLRHAADVWVSNVDKLTTEGEVPVQLCNYVDVYKNDVVRPSETLMRATARPDEISRFHLEVGDTLLTKDSEDPSDIGISAYVAETADDMVCGYHLAIARPRTTTHPRYLTWATRTRPALNHFSNNSNGISRYGLSTSGLMATPIPLPSLEEQRRIADFLDDHVARSDQIIAARQQQAAQLEQALLRRSFDTVRGSLVGGARKASGLDWLGMIPADWPVLSVTSQFQVDLGKMLDEKRQSGEYAVPYLRNTNVQWDSIDTGDLKMMDIAPEELDRFTVQPGDLLICEGGQPGRAAIWSGDVTPLGFQKALHRARSRGNAAPGWLLECLRAAVALEVFTVGGGQTTISHLPNDQLRATKFPFPSAQVQQRELVQLQERRGQIRSLQAACRDQVALLQEYKQSLITAAVTGEFDVTTASTRIPE